MKIIVPCGTRARARKLNRAAATAAVIAESTFYGYARKEKWEKNEAARRRLHRAVVVFLRGGGGRIGVKESG